MNGEQSPEDRSEGGFEGPSGDVSEDRPEDPAAGASLEDPGTAPEFSAADSHERSVAEVASAAAGRRKRQVMVGAVVGVLALVLVFDGIVLWRNWDEWAGCFEAEDRVIDEEAGLCYERPEGWTLTSDAELEERSGGPGEEVYSSGLELDIERAPEVQVSPNSEVHLEGREGEVTLEELAEAKALGSQLMQSGEEEAEVDSESATVDGCEAAIATARHEVSGAAFGEDGDFVVWSRVTVIDVGDGTASLYSAVLVPESDEDGDAIAMLEDIHESIAVL